MVSLVACQALREKKRIELRYDGYSRVVEVHAVGYKKNGDAVCWCGRFAEVVKAVNASVGSFSHSMRPFQFMRSAKDQMHRELVTIRTIRAWNA
ncbi:hypothetical protein J2X72_001398 [Phyllobacterium sp. 1468]|nr:hypothetical protein [Phyllobacterium sp. 1468]